jgi:hypothetical protein
MSLTVQFMESFAHESTMEDVVAKVSANSIPNYGAFDSETPFGVGRSIYNSSYDGHGPIFQLTPNRSWLLSFHLLVVSGGPFGQSGEVIGFNTTAPGIEPAGFVAEQCGFWMQNQCPYFQNGSTPIMETPPILPGWHHIIMGASINSSGSMALLVDGLMRYPGTGNTQGGVSAALVDQIKILYPNYRTRLTNLICWTSDLDDIRDETLPPIYVVPCSAPTANGTYSDFIPSTGTNWQNVSPVPSTDAQSNSSGTVGAKDSFKIGATTGASCGGIQITTRAELTSPGGVALASTLRMDGSDFVGPPQVLIRNYEDQTVYRMQVRPTDSEPFTIPDLNDSGFEIGYKITDIA